MSRVAALEKERKDKMRLLDWKMNYGDYKDLACTPPCSMYSVLYASGLIKDPYFGCNELELTELSQKDCEFSCVFFVDEKTLSKEWIELVFYGLDTICDIYVNGKFIAHTENMHRKYAFDVKNRLKLGENNIKLYFSSPLQYFKKENNKHFLWMNKESIPGASHLRKALYMAGWDWGPTLPDMGIFRPVEIVAYDTDKIQYMVISQKHTDNKAELSFSVTTERNSDCEIYAEIDGIKQKIENEQSKIVIDNPKLWWVRGYGEQPLYDVTFTLEKNGEIIDTCTKRIGIRTLTMSTEKAEDGNEFCFVNNGVKIFAMGANFIPQDAMYARITPERTQALLNDFAFANFNCIRVWGGGYYPEDYFFDMCDEMGFIVWEDFMIACANICLSDRIEEELNKEVTYNLNRIAHHACLGVLCGNNEMEPYIHHIGEDELAKIDYLTLYEHIIPDLCAKFTPDTFYWPSSPSSGGGLVDPEAHNKGDVHYWDVWHGSIPFEAYRKYKFRFCSEYGFESFPNIKTIKSFCNEKDFNPFAKAMENHQKCPSGNMKILMYLSANYLYPYSFENLVYASQLLQAEAIRCGVEHFRRIRGYCMGSLYWQANDCWPVASWSSVDYYGRYKALHYAARKFYAPVAEGVFIEGDTVVVNVANETRENKKVTVRWRICNNENEEVAQGAETAEIVALSSKDVISYVVKSVDKEKTYFCADLYDENGTLLMRRTELFVKPKCFEWKKPNLSVRAEQDSDGVIFYVKSDVFAHSVEIDFATHDVVLSDNYIDLVDGQEYKIISKTKYLAEELMRDIQIKSVYDIR